MRAAAKPINIKTAVAVDYSRYGFYKHDVLPIIDPICASTNQLACRVKLADLKDNAE